MTTREMIAVLEAYNRGERLDFRAIRGPDKSDEWHSGMPTAPSFDFWTYEYRVTPANPPKPREWWISPADKESQEMGCVHVICEAPVKGLPNLIHVREVID